MTRPRKPKLPLHRGVDGRLYQRTYHTPTDQEIAWLNRAAEEWPKLRRALREAEKRAKEAEAKLTKARDDALEEAARVADAHAKDWLAVRYGWGRGKASAARDIAENLRAIKSDAADSADGHGGAAR